MFPKAWSGQCGGITEYLPPAVKAVKGLEQNDAENGGHNPSPYLSFYPSTALRFAVLVRSTDITIYHDMVMVPDLRVRSANFAGGIGLVMFDDDKFGLVMPNGRAYKYLFRRN